MKATWWLRWTTVVVMLALLGPTALAGKGGNGKGGGGGGGGSPSPIDNLPGVLVFHTDKNSSESAWWACDPNGTNLRSIPHPTGDVTWASVSPYPVHIIMNGSSIRPLEASSPVVTVTAAMFAPHLPDGLIQLSRPQFRYRSEAAGLGSEIDGILFQGAAHVGVDAQGDPITAYDFYSAPVIRNAQGVITGIDAENVSRLAPLPFDSLAIGGGPKHHLAPDGDTIVYAERFEQVDGSYSSEDGGLHTYDTTDPDSATYYTEFDASEGTCLRSIAWAQNPALDRLYYQVGNPCGLENTNDGKSIYRDLVVADLETGDSHVVLSSRVTGGYGPSAWSPGGTFILLVGPGRKSRGVTYSDLYLVDASGSSEPVRAVRASEMGSLAGTVWGAQITFGN